MPELVFRDDSIAAVGEALTTMAQAMPDGWSMSCDLGDAELAALMEETRTTINNALLGAAAQTYALGAAATDAVEVFQQTDAAL